MVMFYYTQTIESILQSQKRRETEVPPLILREKIKFEQISKQHTERKVNYGNARALDEGFQVNPPTKQNYRRIVTLLNNKIEYDTYQTEEEKSLRAVIKEILQTIPTQQTIAELQKLVFHLGRTYIML